jgi:hypothetical protein
MLNIFTNILFTNPWVLSGLAALPVLWFLLRVTPPAPRRVALPSARFLKDLIPTRQTSTHTPWWILILRMATIALIIFAFAGPIYNPAPTAPDSKPVLIVFSNDWAAAASWNEQITAATQIISKSRRGNQNIFILTTAPSNDDKKFLTGPTTPAQAEGIIKAMTPLPWPGDIAGALKDAQTLPEKIDSIWLSHGIEEPGADDLYEFLKSRGRFTAHIPAPEKLPLTLKKSPARADDKISITIAAPGNIPPGRNVAVHALGARGQIIDTQPVKIKPGEDTEVFFNTPQNLGGDITQFKIVGAQGAGAVYIIGGGGRKTVAIFGAAADDNPKPFIEARFYIRRALEGFANIIEGPDEKILNEKPDVVILPDTGNLPLETLSALEKWVKDGGLLIRISGPNMAASNEQFLTPLPIRGGNRALDGAMTWEKPQKISAFPETSPLYGINFHEDIFVRQQILTQPTSDMESMTWAKLSDGTPLITSAPFERGRIVLIHTAIDPAWSDLPLSGAFVEILKRIIGLAGRTDIAPNTGGILNAIWVMDGYGAIVKPGANVKPIPANEFQLIVPGPSAPPGLYGRAGYDIPLNLGDHIQSVAPAELPGATIYGQNFELDLMPYLLYAALMLFIADWTIMVLMAGYYRIGLRSAMFCALVFLSFPANAFDPTPTDIDHAAGFYLAYIKSNDAALDSLTQSGLENLAAELSRRTSAEVSGVIGLDPVTDDLVFFPVIYWPLGMAHTQLSPAAISNIQKYLNHGGTILFDTRDGAGENDTFNTRLGTAIGGLSIPALAPMPQDHVLMRSFYLLDSWPGRMNGGALWMEAQSAPGRDGVSSMIIGGNDWAGAWAEGTQTRQNETAIRFGVNVVIYALTGNYKADQVHVKSILERLGR